MTGGQFREVDFDLLADYVGGALHGTPAETEIAELIDHDPGWADAYSALTFGVDAVRLDLAGWAAESAPMPSEVVDRLSSALARASRPGGPGSSPDPAALVEPVAAAVEPSNAADQQTDTSTEPADVSVGSTDTRSGLPDSYSRPASDSKPRSGSGASSGSLPSGPTRPAGRSRRQLSGVPVQAGGDTRQTASGPGRRRRWTRRMAGPILVATVVAGFAGFVVARLVDPGGGADQSAGTAVSSAEDAAQPPQVFGSGPPQVVEPSAERVLATGTDYTPTSLSGSVSELAKRAATPSAAGTQAAPDDRTSGSGQEPGVPVPSGTPDVRSGGSPCCRSLRAVTGLERLADRSVLADCLASIAATHARGPVVVELVDYAAFRGRAALVVVFSDRSGARWAWVTGPGCGSSTSGADVTYQTRVG